MQPRQGRAVSELVSAVGGVVRAVAEHHGNHTDRPDEDDAASSSSSCCGGAAEPGAWNSSKWGSLFRRLTKAGHQAPLVVAD